MGCTQAGGVLSAMDKTAAGKKPPRDYNTPPAMDASVVDATIGPEFPIPEPCQARGPIVAFKMNSADSKFYTGVKTVKGQNLSQGKIDPDLGLIPDTEQGTVHHFTMLDHHMSTTGFARASATTKELSQPSPFVRDTEVYVPPELAGSKSAPVLLVLEGLMVNGMASNVSNCCFSCCKGLCCNCCGKSCDMIAVCKNFSMVGTVDKLIQDGKIPPCVVVMTNDYTKLEPEGWGSERSVELTATNDKFARYLEEELFPEVEKQAGVTLSKDPAQRVVWGSSSAAACAVFMAWTRPDLWRNVIAVSCNMVNSQYPFDPVTPGGHWDFHSGIKLLENGKRNFGGALADRDDPPGAEKMRVGLWHGEYDFGWDIAEKTQWNGVLGIHRTTAALKAKGHDVRLTMCKRATHIDPRVIVSTWATAVEWAWNKGGSGEAKSVANPAMAR